MISTVLFFFYLGLYVTLPCHECYTIVFQAVSREIRRILTERAANFNIALDDVSITSLTFGREFTAAIEAKQVAAQEAERAKFVVEKAEQDKRSAIIRAQVYVYMIKQYRLVSVCCQKHFLILVDTLV